jgi:HEAT repeat protein
MSELFLRFKKENFMKMTKQEYNSLAQSIREEQFGGMIDGIEQIAKDLINNPDANASLFLLRLLGNLHYPDLRLLAAKALGSLGNENAVMALGNSIPGEESEEIRKQIIASLAGIGNSGAIRKMGLWLADDEINDDDLSDIIYYLGELKNQEANFWLFDFLQKDREFYLIRNAVDAIEQIGGEESVDRLILLLENPDEAVVRRAREALERIDTPAARAAVETYWSENDTDSDE